MSAHRFVCVNLLVNRLVTDLQLAGNLLGTPLQIEQGHISATGPQVRLPDHQVVFTSAQQAQVKALLADFRRDPYFGFAVPTSVPGVEPHILYPVKTWQDKAAFAETAKRLVSMFRENFKRFEAHVDADVRAAEPQMSIAA